MKRALFAAAVLLAAGLCSAGGWWLGHRVSRPPLPDALPAAQALERRLRAVDVIHCDADEILVATCEPRDVRTTR